jgi:hypothetical protein
LANLDSDFLCAIIFPWQCIQREYNSLWRQMRVMDWWSEEWRILGSGPGYRSTSAATPWLYVTSARREPVFTGIRHCVTFRQSRLLVYSALLTGVQMFGKGKRKSCTTPWRCMRSASRLGRFTSQLKEPSAPIEYEAGLAPRAGLDTGMEKNLLPFTGNRIWPSTRCCTDWAIYMKARSA